MIDLIKRLDGLKTYLIGAAMMLAGGSLWLLNALGVEATGVTSDAAVEMFWAGLALLGLRDAQRKVIATNVQAKDASERAINMMRDQPLTTAPVYGVGAKR